MKVNNQEEFNNLTDGNRLIGEAPEMKESSVEFRGKGNILFCEKGTVLRNSKITFRGDGGLAYLSYNALGYNGFKLEICPSCVFAIGEQNLMGNENNSFSVVVSENRTGLPAGIAS